MKVFNKLCHHFFSPRYITAMNSFSAANQNHDHCRAYFSHWHAIVLASAHTKMRTTVRAAVTTHNQANKS